MGSQIRFGSKTFNAIGKGKIAQQDQKKQYFNFAATFNSLTGAVPNIAFTLYNSLSFPFPVFLREIHVNGMYYDTTGSLAKTQPLVVIDLYPFGFSSSLNVTPPNYTLGGSATIDKGVTITGLLNNNPIKYDSEIPLYVPPLTNLVLSGSANFFAAAAVNDVLIINVRTVFEAG